MSAAKTDPSVFISYRIDDTGPTATHLARELEREFGEGQVFIDHRKIEGGKPWDAALRSAVAGSKLVLALIGKKWLSVQDAHGRRRLDTKDDWVRHEIALALELEDRLIPVLVGGAPPLAAEAIDNLPEIAALASIEAVKLRRTDWDSDFSGIVTLLEKRGLPRRPAPLAQADAPRSRPFRSNVADREGAPFVGRDRLLEQIAQRLGDPSERHVLVLHGQPGVGKSEVAREYARSNLERYPGGAFFISMGTSGPPIELARIGATELGLPAGDLDLADQCLRALQHLADSSALLVYDNVADPDAVLEWLPAARRPCHVLITSVHSYWEKPRWDAIAIEPLGQRDAMDLVAEIAGEELAQAHGADLVRSAGGVPMQLCPTAAELARAEAFGYLAEFKIGLSKLAISSHAAVWKRLGPDAQLIMWTVLQYDRDRIPRAEISSLLTEVLDWPAPRCSEALAQCQETWFLQGGQELRLHQLVEQFVRTASPDDEAQRSEDLRAVRCEQAERFFAAAAEAGSHPADAEVLRMFLAYRNDLSSWADGALVEPLSGTRIHSIGYALSTLGQFAEAREWFERAVAEKEQGLLGSSLHEVGFCLSRTGSYAEAREWYERAVAEKEQGDVHGRVDHESLGKSLHQVGVCLSSTGSYADAREWYERAVAEAEQGDVHGRVDREFLASSLEALADCLEESGNDAEAGELRERAACERAPG